MSSTVSCSSAAAIVIVPIPRSARICATATGCVMYGSPDLRFCPSCARSATEYARSMSVTSAFGWCDRTVRISVSTAPAGCAREKSRGSRDRSDPMFPVVFGPSGLVGRGAEPGRLAPGSVAPWGVDSRVSVMMRLQRPVSGYGPARLRASGQCS